MNTRIPAILSLIVAVAIFFGYVNPTWSGKIASQNAALASDDAALAAAAAYTAEQSQLTSAQSAIDANDLARLSVFLPDSVNNVRLILDLNALAARSGLALSNIDVVDTGSSNAKAGANTPAAGLPAAGTNPLGSIDLALSAVGTYASLQNFLQGVEKSGRLLDVRDLTVKGSNTGAYTYQMTVRLYWLR